MAKPVIMPKFGFTQEEGTIVRWLARDGESVEKGDPICEVTTDKVNMEVEAPASGILGGLRFKVDDVVPVTEVIAYILELGEQPPRIDAAAAPSSMPAADEPDRTDATPVARRLARDKNVALSRIQGTGPGGRITRRDVERHLGEPIAASEMSPGRKPRATPAARRLAGATGLDLAQLRGSGPRGRIQAKDVAAAQGLGPNNQARSLPAGTLKPLSGMRRTIAERMASSARQAPHIDLSLDIDMAQALGQLERLRQKVAPNQPRITLTAVILWAVARSLRQHPLVNAYYLDEGILELEEINVGFAVEVPDGLLVPVVHAADQKSLPQIAEEIDGLGKRARAGTSTAEDVANGTFTVSNLGMFGIDQFKAIINPPQVAILAVGRVRQVLLPAGDGKPALRSLMNVTLSADHRALNGAEAARFLASFKEVLERAEAGGT